jgi:hypothetical protein
MPVAATDRKPLQAPAPQKNVEETPSLWTRITNCVSSILKQLWEWITCCCRSENKSFIFTKERTSEVVNKMIEGNISLPFKIVIAFVKPDRDPVLQESEVSDQTVLDSEIQDFESRLPSKLGDDWSLRILLGKSEDQRGVKFVFVKLDQNTRGLPIEIHHVKSKEEADKFFLGLFPELRE